MLKKSGDLQDGIGSTGSQDLAHRPVDHSSERRPVHTHPRLDSTRNMVDYTSGSGDQPRRTNETVYCSVDPFSLIRPFHVITCSAWLTLTCDVFAVQNVHEHTTIDIVRTL